MRPREAAGISYVCGPGSPHQNSGMKRSVQMVRHVREVVVNQIKVTMEVVEVVAAAEAEVVDQEEGVVQRVLLVRVHQE